MRKHRWLRLALAATAFLLVASAVLSRALQDGWARRPLLTRLSAGFGRPVEVGHFGFSLLDGPRLEADSVTVAEDPAFGHEYFLRAEQLAVGLRWSALLRGRLEFGTVSFVHPSLNLVRAADGRWNIERWLPPPPDASGNPAREAAVRLNHIEIDTGRINFKRGDEKLPFALVNVSGSIDQDSSGRWRIDLRADPMRVPALLQDIGTVHLRGTVAGTSARLRPGTLILSWQEASLADALRLADGSDFGVRGTLSAHVVAAIHDSPAASGPDSVGDAWTISAAVRLAGVHRWDLPASDTDPALQANVSASWRPGEAQLKIADCVIQAPHSRLVATGDVGWSKGFDPRLQFASSRVGLEDLDAWRSAFLPRIANGLAMHGTLGVEASVAGWPLRIKQAAFGGTGASLRLRASSPPIRVGPLRATLRHGSLVLAPVSVTLPEEAKSGTAVADASPLPGTLRVEGAIRPSLLRKDPGDWGYRLAVSGKALRVQDLAAVAQALGWKTPVGWTVDGPASLHLVRTGSWLGGTAVTRGTLDLHGLRLTSVLLNQPLVISAATVQLLPGERRIRLAGAKAFGAQWKGTLDWRAAEKGWAFDLSAGRLDVAALDRWLGPRARPSLLERMLPFAIASRPEPAREAAIAHLEARGRLRIGTLLLAPLQIRNVDVDLDLSGRNLALWHAQADFYGGRVDGAFQAQLAAQPAYSFRGRIERVNLAALTAATVSLAGRFGGLASGDLALAARGVGRRNLLASLEGEGRLQVLDPVLRRFTLSFGPQEAAVPEELRGESRFESGTVSFRVAAGHVRLAPFVLAAGPGRRYAIAGSVDFSRRLDLTIHSLALAGDPLARPGAAERNAWTVGGTLDAPQVDPQTSIARNRAVRSGAHR